MRPVDALHLARARVLRLLADDDEFWSLIKEAQRIQNFQSEDEELFHLRRILARVLGRTSVTVLELLPAVAQPEDPGDGDAG